MIAISLDDILSSTMSIYLHLHQVTTFVFEGFQYISILSERKILIYTRVSVYAMHLQSSTVGLTYFGDAINSIISSDSSE